MPETGVMETEILADGGEAVEGETVGGEVDGGG